MATAAKKLQKAQANVTPMPTGTVKLGRETFPAPANLAELVRKGRDIKVMMDELKAELDTVNAAILAEVPRWMDGVGTLHIITEGVDCTVTLRDAVAIENVGTLRELLGDRFPDLVKEKVNFTPEAKLVAIATDGDHPLARDVASCLRIQEAKASVSYKAA